jgi:hypothetical protein
MGGSAARRGPHERRGSGGGCLVSFPDFAECISDGETIEEALVNGLIADTVARHNTQSGTLTLHADCGAAMRSKPAASLLVDLDVATSHSRPHVSDDNPYSEAQFKTMEYCLGLGFIAGPRDGYS